MAGTKRKSTKKTEPAPRGDAAGMAAIRIWAMDLETAAIRRYVGNAPTLEQIKRIYLEAARRVHAIKPALMSDCGNWTHQPNCECDPSI